MGMCGDVSHLWVSVGMIGLVRVCVHPCMRASL